MAKKKNNKNYFILIIVLIALICMGVGLFVLGQKNVEPKEKLFYEIKEEETKVIDICKDKNCGVLPQDKFYKLNISENYASGLKDSVKKINAEIDNYYEEVDGSEECPNARDKFYHSKFVDIQFENYENNDYLSITPIYTITNLCEMKATRPEIKTYIYDKANQKLLTQEEFIGKIDISDDEIQRAIKDNNDLIKEEENIEITDQTFDNYLLYFASDGSINVAYTIEGSDMYYTAFVK